LCHQAVTGRRELKWHSVVPWAETATQTALGNRVFDSGARDPPMWCEPAATDGKKQPCCVCLAVLFVCVTWRGGATAGQSRVSCM
jgi:hypothetical protein